MKKSRCSLFNQVVVICLMLLTVKTNAQVFTTLFNDENQITLQDGHLRLNTLQLYGKIYYTSKAGVSAEGASVLCVVDVNGKNGKQLPQTRMIGANYLAATSNYIYYNSYVDNIRQYYLYRMNIATEKVELVVYDNF